MNSSACFGTTRTENSSPDRSSRAARTLPRCPCPQHLPPGLRLPVHLLQDLQRVLDHPGGLAAAWCVTCRAHRIITGCGPSWLLAELVKSELASAEERSLSHTVFTEEARFDPHGTDLRLVVASPELDAVVSWRTIKTKNAGTTRESNHDRPSEDRNGQPRSGLCCSRPGTAARRIRQGRSGDRQDCQGAASQQGYARLESIVTRACLLIADAVVDDDRGQGDAAEVGQCVLDAPISVKLRVVAER